ncbi:transcriptional regulator [Deferribacteraceae bacterium V6Fe1]|nr:transcriptional regulator [Deferribacteraceae bacterium V6Fe1]
MKKNYYALTFVSVDKPGIVAEVTKVLYEEGFNIEDSSSTLLRGFFSMILIVSHEKSFSAKDIITYFSESCKKYDLSISVKPIDNMTSATKYDRTYIVSVYGSDKPGIVYKVAKFLSEKKINIVDLQTKVAGKEDKPLYIMVLEVNVPSGLDESWMLSLKKISDELGTDINVRQIETYEF